jgi:hypothetical protein
MISRDGKPNWGAAADPQLESSVSVEEFGWGSLHTIRRGEVRGPVLTNMDVAKALDLLDGDDCIVRDDNRVAWRVTRIGEALVFGKLGTANFFRAPISRFQFL